MFKEKSPGLETNLVSKPGLRNPCEISRFMLRIALKIPHPKEGK